ncbi:hypothetical protein AX17_001593 [Amanita inopinata Kibby_2008]|nr:hypothetical protein AX17_001593 [Amanita inopinata Kibby_2008]
MSTLNGYKQRSLSRPGARNLPLLLVEHPLFRSRTYGAYEDSTPSTNGVGDFFLASARSRPASAKKLRAPVPFSALTTGSVYSQDSWQEDYSPQDVHFHVDTRRFALALSPTVVWNPTSAVSQSVDDCISNIESPKDRHAQELPPTQPTIRETIPETSQAVAPPVPPLPPVVKPIKRVTSAVSLRASISSKAFGKLLSRVSLPPSPSKRLVRTRRRTAQPTSRRSTAAPQVSQISTPPVPLQVTLNLRENACLPGNAQIDAQQSTEPIMYLPQTPALRRLNALRKARRRPVILSVLNTSRRAFRSQAIPVQRYSTPSAPSLCVSEVCAMLPVIRITPLAASFQEAMDQVVEQYNCQHTPDAEWARYGWDADTIGIAI